MPITKPLLLSLTFPFILLIGAMAYAVETNNTGATVIRYPDLDEPRSKEYTRFFLEVLRLALEKSNVNYSLEPVPMPYISENRSVRNLQSGVYTIHWLNSNIERETDLVPIRVPLFKGLIGWRLLFIRKEDQPLFARIKSVDDLKKFVAGQGHDWPDTEIFKANRIKMVTSANYNGLFKMLPAGRIDYFPRSVIEIQREQELFPEMYIEKTMAIHYPSAYYFFVSGANAALAREIEAGLVAAVKDGDFDRVFNKYCGEAIKRARLGERRIIHLDNPLKFPLDQKGFWYRLPEQKTKQGRSNGID